MAEWTHPRRASKETISYLSQIEPILDRFEEGGLDHSDLRGSGGPDGPGNEDDDDVGREQMLDNVLEEIKNQTASIMEDRKGSVMAEKIARRLTPLQLRTMLSRCRGYMLSLANNRYSSHVLQTLLSSVGYIVEAEASSDEAMGGYFIDTAGDQSEKPDLLQDVILSLVSELSGHWAELMCDISGSHVGRAFLQVLGGLPILTERRGKQSRHAHSIEGAVGPTGAARIKSVGASVGAQSSLDNSKPATDPEALDKWSTPHRHVVPTSFQVALKEATLELESLPAGDLLGLVCDKFGCPLLAMLLRVYGNLAVDPASGQLPCLDQGSPAMSLATKVLQWDDTTRSKEVIYAMAGESTASHFLEAVIWLTPQSFFQQLYQRCFESRLLEYCEHAVSNFLIQAALQRVDDKTLAEDIVAAIVDHASTLLAGKRAGVMWRAAQACFRLSLKPKVQAKLVGAISSAFQRRDNDGIVEGSGDAAAGVARNKSPSPTSDPFMAARAWVPALLDPRLPCEEGPERLCLSVPGARIVQNVLRFEPTVAAPVLKAVAALPEAVLLAVARDNLGSRCLIDPILEAAGGGNGRGKSGNRPAEDARRTILRAFRGHFVAMACDRIAWHVLLKCFRGGEMKDKRMIAEELASGGEQTSSRMSGYPSGRAVMAECMMERFSRSPREWDEAFKNRENRAKMLEEILAVEAKGGKGGNVKNIAETTLGEPSMDGASPPPGVRPVEGDEVGEDEDEDERQEMGVDSDKPRQKRRRQRGRGRRGKGSDATAGEGGDEDAAGTMTDGTLDQLNESSDKGSLEDASTTPKSKSKGKLNSKKAKSRDSRPSPGEQGMEKIAAGESARSTEAMTKKKSKKSRASSGRAPEGAGDKAGGSVSIQPTSTLEKNEDGSCMPKKKKKKKRKRDEEVTKEEVRSEKKTGGVLNGDNVDMSFVLDAIKQTVPSGDPGHEGPRELKKGGQKRKGKRSGDVTGAKRNGVFLRVENQDAAAEGVDSGKGPGKGGKGVTKRASGISAKRKKSSGDAGGFRLF